MALSLPVSGAIILPSGSALAASPATGDRTAAIATMQKFLDEFGSSMAANGYQKLPSGLIIQWGQDTCVGATKTVTYPIAFPNACHVVFMTAINGSVLNANSIPIVGLTKTTTSFGANIYTTSGTLASQSFSWLAIGY